MSKLVPCPTCLYVMKPNDDPFCIICISPDFSFYECDKQEIERRKRIAQLIAR